MERKYKIYQITGPSDKRYIGLTRTTLKHRFNGHLHRVYKGNNHPLYNSMRKHGKECFRIEILEDELTKEEAQKREQEIIASYEKDKLYNISPGGECDGDIGGKIFWGNLAQDPIKRKEYLAKLSKTKMNNDWSDYKDLAEKAQKWRKENAREAYYTSRRNIRIASRGRIKLPYEVYPMTKEALLRKHKPGLIKSVAVTKVWGNRTKEEREKLSASISKGNKKFWDNLKADPEKYKEYIARVNEVRNGKKKNI